MSKLGIISELVFIGNNESSSVSNVFPSSCFIVFLSLKFKLVLEWGFIWKGTIDFFVRYFLEDFDLREIGLLELECDF